MSPENYVERFFKAKNEFKVLDNIRAKTYTQKVLKNDVFYIRGFHRDYYENTLFFEILDKDLNTCYIDLPDNLFVFWIPKYIEVLD